jgi:general secretion pathway protein F
MPHFRYRAVTQSGEVVVGDVEAPSRAEVIRRIEYLGQLPVDAEPAKAGMLTRGTASAQPKSRDVTVFLRQLAMLARAGLTLENALASLAEDTSKALAQLADALRAAISSGDSFAEALERHPSVIEPAYVAMVRAGEASGKLEAVLRAIVEDRTRREALSERINATIRYPLFLILSSVIILVFFLTYVVPQFESVFQDLGGRLNAGAAFVLAASTWLRGNLDLSLGLCLALILGSWLVFKRPALRTAMVAALTSLPGIAGPMRDRRAARIIGTLGLLVENGVALPVALKIVRDIVSDPRHVAMADQVHEQVRSGRRFADALAETDLLPPLAVQLLRVGDETGDLATIAHHAAQFYEQRLATGLDRLMGAIGPVTIILVSVVIGALIVSIMSALLSITELTS